MISQVILRRETRGLRREARGLLSEARGLLREARVGIASLVGTAAVTADRQWGAATLARCRRSGHSMGRSARKRWSKVAIVRVSGG